MYAIRSYYVSMGDLADTIKSQQYEISVLRKENQLLKTKLSLAIQQGYRL